MSEELALNDDQIGEPRRRQPREAGRRSAAGTDWWARGQGHLLAGPRGARLPQLHRQALLHPVRIDAARAAGRRPAGRDQISLWLVVRLADDPQSGRDLRRLVLHQPEESWGVQLPFIKGRLFGRLPERGDVVIVTPPGTQHRLYQARDRPAGRPARRCAAASSSSTASPVQARAAARHGMIPVDANTHVRRIDIPARCAESPTASRICRLPLVTRDAAQRPPLRHDRPAAMSARRQLRRRSRSPPTTSS